MDIFLSICTSIEHDRVFVIYHFSGHWIVRSWLPENRITNRGQIVSCHISDVKVNRWAHGINYHGREFFANVGKIQFYAFCAIGVDIVVIIICHALGACQFFKFTIIMIESNCKNNAVFIVFKCIQALCGVSIITCAIRD